MVEDIPDLEEANEVIKEDDTMKWDEEEEEEDLEEPTAPPDLAEEDMDPKV